MTPEEIQALRAKDEADNAWTCAGCEGKFSPLANCRKIADKFFCWQCYRQAFPNGM
jgi:hypothetical protein